MPAAARGRPRGEKPWSDALRKAAYQAAADGDGRLIDRIARTTVQLAMEGDVAAIKEIGDRLDGKAAQQLVHTGDDDADAIRMTHTIERKIVDPAN